MQFSEETSDFSRAPSCNLATDVCTRIEGGIYISGVIVAYFFARCMNRFCESTGKSFRYGYD